MNKIKYIAAVLMALVGLGLQQAKADTFVSSLNTGNSAISGFTGPYGTVSITTTGTNTATVTFTSNTVAGNTYLFGDGVSVALTVNAVTFSVRGIVGPTAGIGLNPEPFRHSVV